MNHHPRFSLLADLADGRAVADGSARHAAGCGDCSTAVAELRGLVGVLRAGAACEPPKAWLRRAVSIPAAARRAALLEGVRTFVARLVFDSGAAPAAAPAFRGAAARHLLFRAGPFDLDLRRDGETVRGSLLPDDGATLPREARARILVRGKAVAEAPLDGSGRFLLKASPRGAWTLEIEGEGTRVRVDIDA